LRKRRKKPAWIKKTALDRIEWLFKFARENKKLSRRYVELAVKIAKKYNVRIPYKREYCRKCYALWVPGKNVRVRTDRKNKRVVYTCLECGHKQYYGYQKRKK